MPSPTAAAPSPGLRASHRRLACALAISASVHGLLLTALIPELSSMVRGLEPPRPLMVSLAQTGSTEDPDIASTGGAEPAVPPSTPDAPATGQGPSPEPAARASPGEAGDAPSLPESEPSNAGSPAPDAFASSEPARIADYSLRGTHPALAAAESASAAMRAGPIVSAATASVAVPLSPRQQRMLTRRLEDWTKSESPIFDARKKLTWKHRGQSYTAQFRAVPGGDDTRPDRLAVEVETEQNGHRLSTVLHMKRLAFSNYAQFVHRWDDAVQIHDDELDGRFHSNSAINLSWSRKAGPKFHGKVTTSARNINVDHRGGNRRRDQIFLGGVETGVRSIRLPRDFVPLPGRLDMRENRVHRFDEDTRIVFHADGSYRYVSLESGLFEKRRTIRAPSTYLLAEGKARLEVQGTVRGKVLVYSPGRVVITGDLVYARHPEEIGDADDYLGIVAGGSVDVASPKVTGPGDLEIHAAIFARRLFRVRDYRHRGNGTLKIFGSLTAGSLTATEPRYATRIRFDPRLEDRRPPGFPVTDKFEVESWNEAWMVDNRSP